MEQLATVSTWHRQCNRARTHGRPCLCRCRGAGTACLQPHSARDGGTACHRQHMHRQCNRAHAHGRPCLCQCRGAGTACLQPHSARDGGTACHRPCSVLAEGPRQGEEEMFLLVGCGALSKSPFPAWWSRCCSRAPLAGFGDLVALHPPFCPAPASLLECLAGPRSAGGCWQANGGQPGAPKTAFPHPGHKRCTRHGAKELRLTPAWFSATGAMKRAQVPGEARQALCSQALPAPALICNLLAAQCACCAGKHNGPAHTLDPAYTRDHSQPAGT